jgi:hypothetical protein
MRGRSATEVRFTLGRIVLTTGAQEVLAEAEVVVADLLCRHVTGDWGDLCQADKLLNNQALIEHKRLMSSYLLSTGEKIWIITEADRSTTTLLLPTEY